MKQWDFWNLNRELANCAASAKLVIFCSLVPFSNQSVKYIFTPTFFSNFPFPPSPLTMWVGLDWQIAPNSPGSSITEGGLNLGLL